MITAYSLLTWSEGRQLLGAHQWTLAMCRDDSTINVVKSIIIIIIFFFAPASTKPQAKN